MKSNLMEIRNRGTHLFPFQHYGMSNPEGNLFVPYHWHNEIEILYVSNGKVNLLLDGDACLLEAGNIYFINHELLHQFSSEDPSLIYYAYVFPMEYLDFRIEDYAQTASVSPLLNRIAFPLCISPTDSCYNKIKIEVSELLEISESKPSGYQLNAKACLYKIISIIQRENLFAERPSNDQPNSRSSRTSEIKKLLSYIKSEYKNSITLEEAASLLNYSPIYFCTFFKSAFGINFIDYLNHFRIEKACILLLSTNMSIMDVGFEVGFKNFSYFIRVFKRLMKMTPKQYRNTMHR